MRYRADIDGLRAIAVVPVVLFHAGVDWIPGGFLGVDVFFVISGYLIARLLIEDLNRGEFSISKFYYARARRILPALFVVALVCVPFALLWMLPSELEFFGRSLISVGLFLSNVYFWSGLDYFSPAAETQPLLHTWSLSVEEQFYLFFPLLLWALRRKTDGVKTSVFLILAVASFALASFVVSVRPSAAFYLLPTRGWELLAGCALAAYESRGRTFRMSSRMSSALSIYGLGMVLAAMLLLDRLTPVPGVSVLPVVLGAALVIACGRADNVVSRVLSLKPFVLIGAISYSLYLWHQPVIAFARLRFHDFSVGVSLACVALSVVLATVTLVLVENPFRGRATWRVPVFRLRYSAVFGGSFAGLVLLVIVGGATQSGGGRLAISGIPSPIADVFAGAGALKGIADCRTRPGAISIAGGRGCRFDGTASPKFSVALWGDSHAMALSEAFISRALAGGSTAYYFGLSGCPSIPGMWKPYQDRPMDCPDGNRDVERALIESDVDVVVLASRWTINVERMPYVNPLGGREHGGVVELLPVGTKRVASEEERLGEIRRRIRDLVDRLTAAGKTVVLVLPPPEFGHSVPDTFLRGLKTGDRFEPAVPRASMLERTARTREILEHAADTTGARLVDLAELFCDGALCRGVQGDSIMFFDDDHLSHLGAKRAVELVFGAFARI